MSKKRKKSVENLNENRLYGFEIQSPEKQAQQNIQPEGPTLKTFTLPQNEDGAMTVAGAGFYGTYVDLDGTFRNETQLITKYRELSIQPEIMRALDNIVNECIVIEDDGSSVDINLDDVKAPAKVKSLIKNEFDYILKMLNFGNMGHEIFRRWYIDGRLFYHAVIDETTPEAGLQELKYIDPRRIRKIREIQKMRDPATGIEIIKKQVEYYLYNERGMMGMGTTMGAKIAPDSIINVNSGLMDPKQTMVLSYLHQAIKTFNNLRMVEDATVIYRLSRAPERRVFYIDVGNMPTVKADQYVKDIMTKYRNKLVYDSSTGEIKDDRKHLSMLEDFWLPRREGSKGTEISTLEGARNLGELEDVKYFKTKLYESLGVPASRLEQNNGFSLGRTTEITRDELNFNRFVQRLRNKFATLFDDLLRLQLVLKNVCTEEEWKEIKEDIWYDFRKDTPFDELKQAEILSGRFDLIAKIDPFVGKYVSQMWVRKTILKQTDDDIAEINEQMQQEAQVQAEIENQMAQDQANAEQQAQDNQIEFGLKQQAAQTALQQAMEPEENPGEKDSRDHEAKMTTMKQKHEKDMMKNKIDLEKIKSKNALSKHKMAAKKPPEKKKKTVAEEAREMGLVYVGRGFYAKDDTITHINENGILTPLEG